MFNNFFDSFYYWALIVSSVCCLFFFRKIEMPFRLLSMLIWVTLANEITAYGMSYSKGNNAIVYNLFIPVEFLFYVLIFHKVFYSKQWSIVAFCCFVLLVAEEIISAVFFHSLIHDQFVDTTTFESVLLVFLSLSLFLKMRSSIIFENLLLESVFWFNSAVLFYYGYNIIFWGLYENSQNELVYTVNFLLSGFLYFAYAFSVFLNYRKIRRM